jgi:hypothetical protein
MLAAMPDPDLLTGRLEAIGRELARRDGALALLGLGSAGLDGHRLDAWSDLDFFVIVAPDHKWRYIDDLDWLSAVAPLAWSVRNTVDGHKALFEDGVFCEFAVFEPRELPGIPYAPGRVVWHAGGFDTAGLEPAPRGAPFGSGDEEFILGELLSNLYVGLSRYARGERLSAFWLVQHHAVDQLLALLALRGESSGGDADGFARDRRFERRFASHRDLIRAVTPGYDDTPAAAERMLDFLAPRVALNPALAAEIRRLVDVGRPGGRPVAAARRGR